MIARACDNHDLRIGIAPYVLEGIADLAVGDLVPHHTPSGCMERGLKDSIAPLHADGLVFVGVLL